MPAIHTSLTIWNALGHMAESAILAPCWVSTVVQMVARLTVEEDLSVVPYEPITRVGWLTIRAHNGAMLNFRHAAHTCGDQAQQHQL